MFRVNIYDVVGTDVLPDLVRMVKLPPELNGTVAATVLVPTVNDRVTNILPL
jgi:hypothetical protein